METTIQRSSPAGVSTARFLARASVATAVVFLISVASVFLPVSLLAPAWQHQQVAALVNNGVIALLALVLIFVAHAFDPRNARVKVLHARFRRWAAVAALGYLLLVPLAITSLAGQVEIEQRQVLRQREQVSRRFDAMRDLIARAPTAQALQQGLARMEGPVLGADDLAEPLPSLRRRLTVLLQQGRNQVLERVKPPDPARRLLLVRETVRLVISSLVFAAAFAAGASRSEASGSLLGAMLRRTSAISQRLRGAVARPSTSTPDDDTPDPDSSTPENATPAPAPTPEKVPVRTRRRRRSHTS